MLQVRIHGRGGEGVVTASELLAALEGGMHAQGFPSFGPERTGAPVVTCEIDLGFRRGCGLCAAECPCGAIEPVPKRI